MRAAASALAVALALTLAGATAQAADHVDHAAPGADLASLLAIARSANPELAAMGYEAEAAAARAEPAGALPDPKLRTELRDITRFGEQNPSLAPSRVGSTRYLLMQDLPWFGKRELKQQAAHLEADSAQGRAKATWADVRARVKGAYTQLWYLNGNARLASEILDLMQRLEKLAQVRYASGLAPQQDVIRAQVEQTAMRSELAVLEEERHHWQARLNALLARPAMARLADPAKLPPLPAAARLDYTALAERVKARNPQLFAEQSKLQAAEKNRELAYKNRYPDFTLGISPIQYGGAVKEWEVMVELNIPLQQSSRRAQEREAEALVSAAQARRDAAENRALADLAENLAALDTARRMETLASHNLLPQAELSFQSALAGYENGKVDFATLLDAQRQVRQARQNKIKAQAEAQMRLAEIERLLGEDL